MANNNDTTSMLNVATLTGLIMDEFLNRIEAWSPALAYVYDEQLTYETALAKYRADRSISDNGDTVLPLFAYKRSVLRPDAENGIGRKSISTNITNRLPDGSVEVYKGLAGTFNMEFLYITRDIQDMERFEISYLLEQSISDIKNMDVFVPALNQNINYSLRYGELDEKIINTDNNYYKALTGVFSVHGLFMALDRVAQPITTINQSVRSGSGAEGEPSPNLCNIVVE